MNGKWNASDRESGTDELMLMEGVDTTAKISANASWTAAQAEALHDPHLHLLVDEDGVAETRGLARVIGRPHVPSEPLFDLDRSWEAGRTSDGRNGRLLSCGGVVARG